jgi:hypothetical protein
MVSFSKDKVVVCLIALFPNSIGETEENYEKAQVSRQPGSDSSRVPSSVIDCRTDNCRGLLQGIRLERQENHKKFFTIAGTLVQTGTEPLPHLAKRKKTNAFTLSQPPFSSSKFINCQTGHVTTHQPAIQTASRVPHFLKSNAGTLVSMEPRQIPFYLLNLLPTPVMRNWCSAAHRCAAEAI